MADKRTCQVLFFPKCHVNWADTFSGQALIKHSRKDPILLFGSEHKIHSVNVSVSSRIIRGSQDSEELDELAPVGRSTDAA